MSVSPSQTSRLTTDANRVDAAVDARSACDMKSGLASAVFAVQALHCLGVQLRGDVMLQSVIGEESGGVGALATIVRGRRADTCVIMGPMNLRIAPVRTMLTWCNA